MAQVVVVLHALDSHTPEGHRQLTLSQLHSRVVSHVARLHHVDDLQRTVEDRGINLGRLAPLGLVRQLTRQRGQGIEQPTPYVVHGRGQLLGVVRGVLVLQDGLRLVVDVDAPVTCIGQGHEVDLEAELAPQVFDRGILVHVEQITQLGLSLHDLPIISR